MNKDNNYYDILQVSHTFEKTELKNNYRKLSKEHHPDKNGGDPTYFKLLAESYKVLTNAELRMEYDRTSKFGSSYDPHLDLLNFNFTTDVSGSKIHERMKGYKKNEMLHIVLELSEFTNKITYSRNVICSKCDGSSNISISNLNLKGKMGKLFDEDEIRCDICDGSGSYQSTICMGCKGEGFINLGLSKCDKCNGGGVISVDKTIQIKESDFIDGKLKIQYYGNQSKYSGSIGNLYIIIKDK